MFQSNAFQAGAFQLSAIVEPPIEVGQLIGPPASDYTYYDKKRQAAYDSYRRKLRQQQINLQIMMLAL
jgi:hypothetical protein